MPWIRPTTRPSHAPGIHFYSAHRRHRCCGRARAGEVSLAPDRAATTRRPGRIRSPSPAHRPAPARRIESADAMTDRPRVDILNFSFYDWDGERVLAGGAERYVLELARVIGALGAQPQIIQNANRYFYNVYRDVPVLGVPAGSSMDLYAMSAGFNDALKGAALVIASPVELASSLRCDAPIIGINHGVHWDYPNNRADLHDPQVDRRIVDAVRNCVNCVSVDANFYNWLRCFDADAAARVRLIPNFVDLQRFV